MKNIAVSSRSPLKCNLTNKSYKGWSKYDNNEPVFSSAELKLSLKYFLLSLYFSQNCNA